MDSGRIRLVPEVACVHTTIRLKLSAAKWYAWVLAPTCLVCPSPSLRSPPFAVQKMHR